MITSIYLYLHLLLFISFSDELNNGLGRTPQMGWNGWNHFGCHVNETIVRQVADAIVATGLAAAGYQYVNLDDCWQVSRDAQGTIQADPALFPSGIPALADYVHSKKLKFGLYSDRGNMTCQRRPGSLGYETKDANTYAAWGVDYLKLDSCYSGATPKQVEYTIMRDALNASGRPIFYSLCGGIGPENHWAPSVGNSWRTTGDILDSWASMISNINCNLDYLGEAGPGAWNDPDMLQVGNSRMTDIEYRTHFSLWAISKAPLMIGCDVRKMNASVLSILTNSEVIAVDQDLLGVQGTIVASAPSHSPNASNGVTVANLSLPGVDPKRYQWTYNAQDGSIRSVYSGRCVTIDRCITVDRLDIVLEDCHIDDPKEQCQGKNQQWIRNTANQTFVSQLSGQCLTFWNGPVPRIVPFTCNGEDNQIWTWNETDGTMKIKLKGQFLMVKPELEVWAGPLLGGSQAVVLLNRGDSGSEEITVNWSDIGFPVDHPAVIRDLWAHQDLGIFTGNYTSPKIDSHAVMMLNITLTK